MKQFKCYKCGSKVVEGKCIKEGISLDCMRCPSCKEEFFTSSELMRFDVLTGRRKMVRKFGVLGDSTIMRIPPKLVNEFKIKQGDYGLFEKRPEGILIRPISSKEIPKHVR